MFKETKVHSGFHLVKLLRITGGLGIGQSAVDGLRFNSLTRKTVANWGSRQWISPPGKPVITKGYEGWFLRLGSK